MLCRMCVVACACAVACVATGEHETRFLVNWQPKHAKTVVAKSCVRVVDCACVLVFVLFVLVFVASVRVFVLASVFVVVSVHWLGFVALLAFLSVFVLVFVKVLVTVSVVVLIAFVSVCCVHQQQTTAMHRGNQTESQMEETEADPHLHLSVHVLVSVLVRVQRVCSKPGMRPRQRQQHWELFATVAAFVLGAVVVLVSAPLLVVFVEWVVRL